VDLAPVFLAEEDVAFGDVDGGFELQFAVDRGGVEAGGNVDLEREVGTVLADLVDAVASGLEELEGAAEVFADVVVGELDVVDGLAALAGAEDGDEDRGAGEDDEDLEEVEEGDVGHWRDLRGELASEEKAELATDRHRLPQMKRKAGENPYL
jgi:hypothetical protein